MKRSAYLNKSLNANRTFYKITLRSIQITNDFGKSFINAMLSTAVVDFLVFPIEPCLLKEIYVNSIK